MLTVGTGVGGGLVLGGRIYRGATGGAGELGHTIVGLDRCGSGRPGADGVPAAELTRVRRRRPRARPAGRARRRALPRVGARSSAAAAGRSSVPTPCRPPAKATRRVAQAVEIWAEHVGIGIANAINTFDPDEVVIGGGARWPASCCCSRRRAWRAATRCPGLGGRTTHSPRSPRRPCRRARRGAARDARAGANRDRRSAPGRRLIAGNWKMHKTIGEAGGFVDELLPRIAGVDAIDVVICPAYPALGRRSAGLAARPCRCTPRTCTTPRRDRSPARCRRRCCSRPASAG